MTTIKAKNDTIKKIVRSEIKRLGNEADLNHINVSGVTNMEFLFNICRFTLDNCIENTIFTI